MPFLPIRCSVARSPNKSFEGVLIAYWCMKFRSMTEYVLSQDQQHSSAISASRQRNPRFVTFGLVGALTTSENGS